MGCGASATTEPQKVDLGPDVPETLRTLAEELVDQPAASLDAVASVLKELEARIKPPRKRCKYGHKCYRQSHRHRLEEAHPGDLDWHEKGEPPRPTLDPSARESEPFIRLRKRLAVGVVRALCRLPSSEPLDLAAGGPDVDALDVEGAASIAQSEAAIAGPPLEGQPGEGDPFDVAAFAEGLPDDAQSNEDLSLRISACLVMGYATDAGLTSTAEWSDKIQAVAHGVSQRYLKLAASRGSSNSDAGIFLYCIMAAVDLGTPRDSAEVANAVNLYTQKRELPSDVGGAVVDMVTKSEDPLGSVAGRQRVGWLHFQDVLIAQAGSATPVTPVSVLEQILVPLVDPTGAGAARYAPTSVRVALARFLGDELRRSVPGQDPDTDLEACESWEAGLEEADGVEAVFQTVAPARVYELALKTELQDQAPLPDVTAEVVSSVLQWAVGTEQRAPLHYALYIAYCMRSLGGTEEASNAWKAAQGVPEWWNPQDVFSTYGTDAYTSMQALLEIVMADEDAPLDPAAAQETLQVLLDNRSRGLVVGFLSSALVRDVYTKPANIPQIKEAIDAGDLETVRQEVPLAAWIHLARTMGVEESEEAAKTGARTFVAHCNEEAENGGEQEPGYFLVSVFVASLALSEEEVQHTVLELTRLGQSLGQPPWWDFSSDFAALADDDETVQQVWAGLRRLGTMSFPASSAQLRLSLRLEGQQREIACSQLVSMIVNHTKNLPLDLASEAQLCSPKLLYPLDGDPPSCAGPPATGILGLLRLARMATELFDDGDTPEAHEALASLSQENLNAVAVRYLGQAQIHRTADVLWYTLLVCAQNGIDTDQPGWKRVAQDFRNVHGLPASFDVKDMASQAIEPHASHVWEKAVELVKQPINDCRPFDDLVADLSVMCQAGQPAALVSVVQGKLQNSMPVVEEEALAALHMEDSDVFLDDVIVPVKWGRAVLQCVQDKQITLDDIHGVRDCAVALLMAEVAKAAEADDADSRMRLWYIGMRFSGKLAGGLDDLVKQGETAFEEYWGLPRWFPSAAMFAHGFNSPEGRRVWKEVQIVARDSPEPNEETLEQLHGALTMAGVDDDTRTSVFAMSCASIIQTVVSDHAELERQAMTLPEFLQGCEEERSFSEAISAAVQLKKAAERLLEGDLAGHGEFHAPSHKAAEDVLSWAAEYQGETEPDCKLVQLFAMLTARGIYRHAKGGFARLPGFREVCDKYWRPGASLQLLDAYDRWDLGRFMAALLEQGPLDVDQLADTLDVFRSKAGAEELEGENIHVPAVDDLLKQCHKETVRKTLLQKMAVKRKHAEKRWRAVAGRQATILEVSDGVLRVQAEDGVDAWIPIPEGGAAEKSLDPVCSIALVAVISKALEDAPVLSETEMQAFEEARENGGDELEASLRVVSIWSVVQRLALQDELDDTRQRVAAKHLMTAMGDSQTRASLQVGLYVGYCLGAADTAAFGMLADAYQTLASLPQYWNVEAMVAAYATGGLAPDSIWEEAEKALFMPDEGEPDKEKVNALLAKAPVEEADSEPWVSLRMSMPLSVPNYWDSSGDTGRFDRMVSVAMRDPLGRPSEIYPCVQKLLDETWKEIPTRDRPCPKKTCEPRPGGCRCVQKDGDPGMPAGLKVRRIIRIEDSFMWERYVKKKDEIAATRAGDTGPDLEVKTTPHLADSAHFLELEPGANEMYLFHGTFVRAALSIAQEGFNMNLAGSNVGTMYGRGGYFCEASSKADEYAKDEPDGYYEGVFAMLLCRIAFGKPFITEYRDEEARRFTVSGEADSTLGDREQRVNTYREFVVYDISQVYPEYVVLYERLGAGYEVQGGLEWGALRRQDSKIVLEVPSNWENAHVDPAQEDFRGCFMCQGLMTLFLQELAKRQMKLAGSDGEIAIQSAYRLEDSATWLNYLKARKNLQERGCEPLATVLGQENSEYASATERAIVMEALRGNARKRCKYGARCYRRDKNPAHAKELSHPGDPDWELRGEDVPSRKLSDVAAWLLEGVDRKINEIYLWCAVEWINSPDDLDTLLEEGVEPLFQTGGGKLRLTESPAKCLSRLPAPDDPSSKRALVFCRALCGRVMNVQNIDDAGLVSMAFAQGQDACVQRFDDGRYHDYVVFQPVHIYPEYCIFV